MQIVSLLLLLPLCFCQNVWPYPASSSFGAQSIVVSPTLAFNVVGQTSVVLTDAIQRYQQLIFWGGSSTAVSSTLTSLDINVISSDVSLQFGIDESYNLSVSSSNAEISAQTVFGALHALETFSQLVNFNGSIYTVEGAPISIEDSPRFPHRGLLIDSSRHFLPVSTILRTIDALAYNKFNVLHWHIVDAESFPAQSQKFPGLTNAAWLPNAIYNTSTMEAVVAYGYARGVRVIPEFDTPGHVGSWGDYYPITTSCPLWSGNIDNVNLNFANNQTVPLVTGLFTEMSGIFTDGFFHIGGDEVVYQCWQDNPEMMDWMQQQGYGSNCDNVMKYYEELLWNHMTGLGKTMIAWEEVFTTYGLTSWPKNLIIEVWQDEPTLLSVAQGGLQGLLAYGWYLDQAAETWIQFYQNEPFQSSTWTPKLESLILGGDVCAWGEQLDEANYDGTVWPRTSAAGERLWSPKAVTNVDSAQPRLINMVL